MTRVARKATYNPKTKQFYGFPETLCARPGAVPAQLPPAGRREAQRRGTTAAGVAKLKQIGHPVGLGMSNELDSNMLLTSLLDRYGGFIQNEENRIVIGQGANRKGAIEALQVYEGHLHERDVGRGLRLALPRRNNQAFLARAGYRWPLNADPIAPPSAEDSGTSALSRPTPG